jgi:prevent-host-death family protein
MKLINIQAAKTHLSRLVEEAAAGEEIVLAKAGRPFVKLVPCTASTTPRQLGGWEGAMQIAAGFDDVDSAITQLFEGKEDPAPPRTRRKLGRR